MEAGESENKEAGKINERTAVKFWVWVLILGLLGGFMAQ